MKNFSAKSGIVRMLVAVAAFVAVTLVNGDFPPESLLSL